MLFSVSRFPSHAGFTFIIPNPPHPSRSQIDGRQMLNFAALSYLSEYWGAVLLRSAETVLCFRNHIFNFASYNLNIQFNSIYLTVLQALCLPKFKAFLVKNDYKYPTICQLVASFVLFVLFPSQSISSNGRLVQKEPRVPQPLLLVSHLILPPLYDKGMRSINLQYQLSQCGLGNRKKC